MYHTEGIRNGRNRQNNHKKSNAGCLKDIELKEQEIVDLRKQGLKAYYTNGKTANRPLFKAFESTKPRIESIAKTYFGD